MQFRQAETPDLPQLAELRWTSRTVEDGETPKGSFAAFKDVFIAFFAEGFRTGERVIWLAVDGNTILSHICIQRVPMVPRPCRTDDWYGYITNAYTRPSIRNRGIGSHLMKLVREWAEHEDLELLIVWPSDRAVSFYHRQGFTQQTDIMQLPLRPYCIED